MNTIEEAIEDVLAMMQVAMLETGHDVKTVRQPALQTLTALFRNGEVEARIAELWNPGLRIPENEKVIRERIATLQASLKEDK